MSVFSDRYIRHYAQADRMIEPFVDYGECPSGVISYGLSSAGYDVRVADEYKIFTNALSRTVDPKNFDQALFVPFKGPVCTIPPNSFVLARSVERFKIPRGIMVVGIGKSTYARCGIILNVTPFEPEWEGIATLEISNTSPCPALIYSNEGICQILFHELFNGTCERSYADRKGIYQDQKGIVLPRVKE